MTPDHEAVDALALAGRLPHRSRGTIALVEQNCTSCMLCARECPDWCIHIEAHMEESPPERPGGRPRKHEVLDRFDIDFSLCMYCGICIEVCPFDALFWSPEFDTHAASAPALRLDRARLGAAAATAPALTLSDDAGVSERDTDGERAPTKER